PPPQQESSDHTWAFLAFRQSTSCSSGRNSAAVLDGSHCGRRGTLHSWDSDTRADRPASCSLACSYFTSYPLFYHPLIESLPSFGMSKENNGTSPAAYFIHDRQRQRYRCKTCKQTGSRA